MRNFILSSALALALLQVLGCSTPVGPLTEAPPVRPFRFLAIADPHFRNLNRLPQKLENFREFLAGVKALHPDFVVILGDVVGEDVPAMAQTRKIARDSGIPVYFVRGNHDDAAEFTRVFGKANLSFTHKGCHIVLYDSVSPDPQWLKAALRKLPAEMPVVFCQHYPLSDTEVRIALDKVNAILALSGHVHDHRTGMSGRLRDLNLPPFGSGFAVIDIGTNGQASVAWRDHGIRQRLVIVHPGPDEPIPPGPFRVRANVFDSHTDILGVECNAGAGWKPMTRLSDWTWSIEQRTDPSHLVVRATDSAGRSWLASRTFQRTTAPTHARLDRDWPTAGGQPDNRRSTPASIRPPLRLAWHAPLVGRLNPPVLANRRLYVTASTQTTESNNVVVCLNAVTGHEIWRKSIGASTVSPAAMTAGCVGVINRFGRVFGFDASTGHERWTLRRATLPYGSMLGDGGGITAADGMFVVANINAIDSRLGEVNWSRPLRPQTAFPPAIASGHILSSSEGAGIIRKAGSGREVWRVGATLDGTSLAKDDIAIFPGGVIARIADGTVVRTIPAIRPASHLALGTDGRILIGTTRRQCLAFDLGGSTSNLLWSFTHDTADISAPTIAGDTVWMSRSDGWLTMVDLKTGKNPCHIPVGPAPEPPIASGNTLFVAAGDGVWAFTGSAPP